MARTRRAPLPLFLALAHPALALGLLAAPLLIGTRASAQGCSYEIEYGMNPSFQTWSSRAIVFVDAVQRAKGWSLWAGRPTGDAPLIAAGALGAGWPDPARLPAGQRVGAYLFGSMEGTIPDGRVDPFVVVWSGTGDVRLEGAYVVGERDRGANRVEVFIDPARGTGNSVLSISWSSPDPADPVRDVHVWLPGMEHDGRLFWPPFRKKVRSINGGVGPHTWRTLDWTRVNEYGRPAARGGFVFDLDGVITPASPSQGTPRGVAPEYQVALCNSLHMNLHYQLPHRTDDLTVAEYVRFLRQELLAIRDGSPGIPGLFGGQRFEGLAPDLTVTIELSNEIWNSIYPVNGWMDREATRKGISFTEQVASQIQLLFDVADSVFSGPDAPRLRKYVAGFTADPGYLRRVLSYLRPGTRVDAVGPAAYVGPRRPDMDAWLVGATAGDCPNCPDASGLLATAEASVEILRPLLAAHRDVANTWINPDGSSPDLELYEGGLNLKAAGEPWAAAARSAQTDPRLFSLFVDRYVPMLVDSGATLVSWYSFMSDQDSGSVDGYGLWNDMNQSLDLPVTRPRPDLSVPKAAVVCLGPPLAATCPQASATVRDLPGNFSSFRTSPPVLGGLLHAEVDPTLSGNTAAFVVASLSPQSTPLPSGQVILSSLVETAFLQARNGPLVTWDMPLPNDVRMAGVPFTLQAIHFGGSSGPNLSNAMDLVFGR